MAEDLKKQALNFTTWEVCPIVTGHHAKKAAVSNKSFSKVKYTRTTFLSH